MKRTKSSHFGTHLVVLEELWAGVDTHFFGFRGMEMITCGAFYVYSLFLINLSSSTSEFGTQFEVKCLALVRNCYRSLRPNIASIWDDTVK
jgi:hypothetical protein